MTGFLPVEPAVAAIEDLFACVVEDHDLQTPILSSPITNPKVVNSRTYRPTIPRHATVAGLAKEDPIAPDSVQALNELGAQDADIDIAVLAGLSAQKQINRVSATQRPLGELAQVRL
jgi:hypothetical protein